MGLDFAIDELYATGWEALDTAGCGFAPDGRCYPNLDVVRETFAARGMTLTITRIDMFDCFRAQWTEADGAPAGAVVGQSEIEAAVYALAQMRRAEQPV